MSPPESRDLRRTFARLFDASVKASERGVGKIRNTGIAEACRVDDRLVARWRDPESDQTLPAWRLLQLSPVAYRSLDARVKATRAALFNEFVPETVAVSGALLIVSWSKLAAEIGAALAANDDFDRTKDAMAAGSVAAQRDLERFVARLGS